MAALAVPIRVAAKEADAPHGTVWTVEQCLTRERIGNLRTGSERPCIIAMFFNKRDANAFVRSKKRIDRLKDWGMSHFQYRVRCFGSTQSLSADGFSLSAKFEDEAVSITHEVRERGVLTKRRSARLVS